MRCGAAAVAMLLAAACGTTVQQPTTGTAPGAPGQTSTGLGDASVPAPVAGQPDTGTISDPASGSAAGVDPLQPQQPGTQTAPTAGGLAAGPAAVGGAGATGDAPKAPIKVGIPYPGGADEANAAAGSNAATGDPKRQWEILVAELNSRGGVAGHRVQPVFFRIDANGDFPTQGQAACAHFTEDNRVVAVLGSGINFTPPSFYDCLDRAGVAVVEGSGNLDREALAKLPRVLLANGMTLDRATASTVDGLVSQGWLAKGSRIGVVTYDEPMYRRVVSNALKQELRRHSASVAEERYVPFPETTAGLGQVAAQTSNAVLRFNTEGINRVLFIELGGEIALFFMQAAESQGYRPVYGLNSSDGGAVLAANVPPAQLNGALGIGWVPAIDVAAASDPHVKSAARQRCLKVFAKEGVTFPSPNELAIGTTQCDMVRLLELAGSQAQTMTGDGIAKGAARLGTSFASAVTFSTRLGPDRRDAAASYRPTAFLDDCQCFRYTGAERATR